MSVEGWNAVLVLGGTRSGKSAFAESLVADAHGVRYVATAAPAAPGDDEWGARVAAHRDRRPATWTTEELGADPGRLAALIADAKSDETLLVDDLGGWVAARLAGADAVGDAHVGGAVGGGHDPGRDRADGPAGGPVTALRAAIRACAARLVLVSPEVGLSLVPTTPVGRAFADAVGEANQAVAAVCDAVVLVVAGQVMWLKPSAAEVIAVAANEHAAEQAEQAAEQAEEQARGGGQRPVAAAEPPPTWASPAATPHVVASAPGPAAAGAPPAGATVVASPAWEDAARPQPDGVDPDGAQPVLAETVVIEPGMDLPIADEDIAEEAQERLLNLDLPGAGLGDLARVVTFAAGTQARPVPQVWRRPRLLLLHGDHAGGAAAGSLPGEAARRVDAERAGAGPLGILAAQGAAELQVVDAPAAGAMEDGPALDRESVEAAMRFGWRLVDEAADAGVDLLILGASGTGTDAAAAAVLAATAGAEPAAILPRAVLPGGRIDDAAWMLRCAAVRDAMRRTRQAGRIGVEVLAELGGGTIAMATGVLLGAAARRTPVLLDGPVGIAAALVSRDLATQARQWCLLPDHGGNPLVRLGADVLGLTPFTDLRLDLGEGANALAALPLLRAALTLAGTLPPHPALAAADDPALAAADDAATRDGDPAAPDGDTATHDGDTQDGDAASQDGDAASQDGDAATRDGDPVARDGDAAGQPGGAPAGA